MYNIINYHRKRDKMSEKEKHQTYVIPENFKNNGRFFGLIPYDFVIQNGIVGIIVYVLTDMFLSNANSATLWFVRLAIMFASVALSTAIRMIYDSSMLYFLESLWAFYKSKKLFRMRRAGENINE